MIKNGAEFLIGPTCYSFADWTMAGEGIIIVLENGQEFRMEITEAK